MTNKSFCSMVGKRLGIPRDLVHRVFSEIIISGKEIIGEGDYWRLPGLGKFWVKNLEATQYLDRFQLAAGKRVYHDVPARRRIKFKFSAYNSANNEASKEMIDPEKFPASIEEMEDV